jgi:UDP-N-acetylmuramate dehydrogenase
VRKAVIGIRNSKLPDPSEVGSAGSFFKNPIVSAEVYASLALSYPDMPHYPAPSGDGVKLSAAWLIERCGWKGRSLGQGGGLGEAAFGDCQYWGCFGFRHYEYFCCGGQ